MSVSNQKGVLYVVATPIGHLDDLSARAIETLQQVDGIAAEDTRHSLRLLQHHAIATHQVSLHEHNEKGKSQVILQRLMEGESWALISDAGTPLISDPGFPLVKAAREAGIQVSPVPGACALIAALSVAGLATARFQFEGFLPRTASARRAVFERHLQQDVTLICYESSHRIQVCMVDVLSVYGPKHPVVVARELTKTHETVVHGSAEAIARQIDQDPNMRKGEFVVLVEACAQDADEQDLEQARQMLSTLLAECSLKTAVQLAVELTGQPKKKLYAEALAIQNQKQSDAE